MVRRGLSRSVYTNCSADKGLISDYADAIEVGSETVLWFGTTQIALTTA